MDDDLKLESKQTLSEGLLGSDIEHAHPPFALEENTSSNTHHQHHQDPFDPSNNTNNDNNDNTNNSAGEIVVDALHAAHGLRGENQAPEYRDVSFAIAFLLHLMVVVYLAFFQGFGSLKQQETYGTSNGNGNSNNISDGGDDTTNFASDDDKPAYQPDDAPSVSLWGLVWLTFLTSLMSLGIASASLKLLTKHAEQMIQISLIGSCLIFGSLFLTLLGDGAEELGFMLLLISVLTALYAYQIWNRIPFAAANLKTALSAIQTNQGVCGIAYGVALVANIWVWIWGLAITGASYSHTTCKDGVCQSHLNFFVAFFLILSYFWTAQVLKNILHVTVAGVVGTWWFDPQDASSVMSPAIQDSFQRSCTLSLGSICMGSLLVATIQTLEQIAHQARRAGHRASMIICAIECILYYIQQIAQYFNKWSMIYVGLYGYDYLTAGRKVLQLFQERGWTAITNDNLVARVLALVCVAVGALTGFVGMLLNQWTGWAASALGDDAHVLVFLLSFIIGFSLSMITMGVVHSAVDTVIVCFAESPNEFQTNHPALSQQMMAAWRQGYPDCGF